MKYRLLISVLLICSTIYSQNTKDESAFTKSLMQDSCKFNTTGKNTYFILEPGYQLVLEGKEGQDTLRLVITVLNETKKINNVDTRIVEESESVNGRTTEISRNYFAFCEQTSSVYYFGEDVDIYKKGTVTSHTGSWIAEGENKAGLIMPGLILLGSRYYQEIAPEKAMDKAEIVSLTQALQTPAGYFTNCLKTEETTDLNPKEKEFKLYAPGIGLIKDENLLLVKYGFIK